MLRPCCPGFLRKARWRLRVETHLSCSQGLSREYKSGPRIFPAKISSQAPVRLCCRAAEVEFPDPRSLPGSPSAAGPRQAQHNRKRSRQKPPRQKENTDPSRLRWLQGVGCGDLRLGVAAASRQQKRTEQNTPLAHLRSLAGPVPALPPVSYVPGHSLGSQSLLHWPIVGAVGAVVSGRPLRRRRLRRWPGLVGEPLHLRLRDRHHPD